MGIHSVDDLARGLAGGGVQRVVIDKTEIASQHASTWCSLWTSTGMPHPGNVPNKTVEICSNETVGGLEIREAPLGTKNYLVGLSWASTRHNMTLELHDRLAHVGGFGGNIATEQPVNLDLNDHLDKANLRERIGSSDFSEIIWMVEWYNNTGPTEVDLFAKAIMNDGSELDLAAAPLSRSRARGSTLSLGFRIWKSESARYIRGIKSVRLSGSTGSVGNFGITATRCLAVSNGPVANYKTVEDWSTLGLPTIPNKACLTPMIYLSTTVSGSTKGLLTILNA